MANSDKDILITPNSGSSSADPKIEYVGADSSGNDTITVETLYDGTKATLSFEGSAGQLFSVVNDLSSDPIFSVNDVSGIPSIEVDSDGEVRLAEFSGSVIIGGSTVATPNTAADDFVIKGSGTAVGMTIAQDSDSGTGTIFFGDTTSSSGGGFRYNHNTGDMAISAEDFVNFNADGLQLSGTTVLDSSRNLTNIGTGTFSGKITINATEALEVGGIRGRAIGDQTGDFIQMYERVHIGYPSGWGATAAAAPAYGLSTWGSVNVGNNGSGTLQMNDTTVIDASRNLTNIGTISSGAITSSTSSTQNLDFTLSNTTSGTSNRVRILTTASSQTWGIENDQNLSTFKIRNTTSANDVLLLNNSAPANALSIDSSGATFAGGITTSTVNTGQGANELYAMNQNVRSSDSPTFADLTVTGNLTITGDINSYNVTDLDVSDKTITLGVGQTEANSGGSGIVIDGSLAELKWDEGDNRWEFNKNLAASVYYQTGTSGNSFYAASFTRSSSTLTTPDIWGSSSTLVLGTSSSDERLALSTDGALIYGRALVRQASSDQDTSEDSASLPDTTGAEIMRFEGGYTNGQYTTEFAKVDRSGNLPLYVRQSLGTANSFSNIARFGNHGRTNGSDMFAVFGGTRLGGNLTVVGEGVFSGNVEPSADSSYSLGTNTVRWANVYADTLYGDGSNITGVTATDSTKMPLAGGTFTGDITISNTSPALNLVDSNSFSDANDRFVYRAADNRVRWEWYDNSAGSTTTVLDLDSTGLLKTNDIRLNAGYHLMRSNHHSGHLEGSYNNVGDNGSKSNPIYTIGSSYNPTDAALSNMYGIGYCHTNASFISFTGASGWGLYVAADGDARVFLGGSNGVISSTGEHYVGSSRVFHDTYHPNADTLTTARTISLTGAVTGSTSFDGSGNVSIATTATSDPTLTLSGDASGSATFTNLGNATLSVTVADDSHNHNHSDGDFTVNGGLVVEGSKDSGASDYGYYESDGTNIILKGDSNGRSAIFFQSEKNGTNINHTSDYGFIQYHPYGYGGTSSEHADMVIGIANDSPDHLILQSPYNGGVKVGYRDSTSGTGLTTQTVFHDAYHPNADKWTTSRTLTLGGDLTGNVSFDGSANFTLTAAVADDSHNHVISNVDGLQTALDAKYGSGSNPDFTGLNVNTTTATTPFMVSRSGSDDAQVVKLGIYDTIAEFKYIEDTSSEGSGNFGVFRFILGGNSGETDVQPLHMNKDTVTIGGDLNLTSGHQLKFNSVAVTASAAELNLLDGVTATTTELNYVDGVTSNIQTQLDGKQASGSYLTGNQTITLSGDVSGSGTTSIAVTIADDSHNHVISNVDGLQTALDAKMALAGGTFTGGTTYNVSGNAITISSGAPQIYLNDTTSGADDFWIHVNSNIFYILADRGDDGSWETPHPLQLNAGTNIGYIFGQRAFTEAYHPNADTLTTARTIGGVSFNGSANIDLPGVNTAGNQNTSGTAAGLSGTPNITVGTITSGAVTSSGTIQCNNEIRFVNDAVRIYRSSDELRFRTGSADRSRIDSSGNFMVNKTTVGVANVGSELRADGLMSATRSGDNVLYLNRTANDGNIIELRQDNVAIGVIGVNSSDNLYIAGSAGGTHGLYFDDASVVPTAQGGARESGTMSLGSSTYKFANLYLSGSASADSLTINGQQVINSSRQLLNLGTISSGVHTINGSANSSFLFLNVSGSTRGLLGIKDTTASNVHISNSTSSSSGTGIGIYTYVGINYVVPTYGDGTLTNNLTDLGNSSSRWKNIYAGSNIYAGADVVAYSSSDERLKDNLERIEQPIEKIQKISGYEFDWNDNQDTFEGHDIGVVAQEVEKVLPEIVETRENGYKAVKYEKMVALLIEGMKEQQEQIKELQEQVQELSKQK